MRAKKLLNGTLLSFCTVLIFLVALSENGSAQENEGADISEALALHDRLQSIETDITDLKNGVGQDELAANIDQVRDEFDALRDDLYGDVVSILGLRVSITSNLTAIFVGLIAFIAAASVFVIWHVKTQVTKAVLDDVESLISKSITERITFARDFTLAQSLGRISYTYFEYYQVEFRDALIGSFPDKEDEVLRISRGAGFARHLANDGLRRLDSIKLIFPK